MTDPVTVPGTGQQVSRRNLVVGGVVAVGLVLGVIVYRHKRATSAANATPTVDTTTGSTLAADGSYQNPNPVRTQDNTVDLTGNQVTTNAQWTQYALAQMGNWDPSFVQVALGLFLADQPLTSDQATVVRTAEGLAGPPPEGHHVIIMASTTSTPGTTPTTDPGTTTPAAAPQFLEPPSGVNLYDWTAQVSAQYSIHLDLPTLRVLNGGSTAASNNPFDNAHINWVAVPGPKGTPKQPLFKNPAPLRIR